MQLSVNKGDRGTLEIFGHVVEQFDQAHHSRILNVWLHLTRIHQALQDTQFEIFRCVVSLLEQLHDEAGGQAGQDDSMTIAWLGFGHLLPCTCSACAITRVRDEMHPA